MPTFTVLPAGCATVASWSLTVGGVDCTTLFCSAIVDPNFDVSTVDRATYAETSQIVDIIATLNDALSTTTPLETAQIDFIDAC